MDAPPKFNINQRFTSIENTTWSWYYPYSDLYISHTRKAVFIVRQAPWYSNSFSEISR